MVTNLCTTHAPANKPTPPSPTFCLLADETLPAQVRAFKGEIDALTTRSRFAENAFLALYKLLREAPDPAVTVQALEKTARAAVEALEGQNRWVAFCRWWVG